MATAFSQHSSNPLEVGSSDKHNQAYLRTLHEHRAHQDPSSEDPIDGFGAADMADYHNQIAVMFPKYQAVQSSANTSRTIGLNDDDDDADMAMPDDQTEHAFLGVPEYEGDTDELDPDDDDELDADGDADEEFTLLQKSPEERAEIEEEIADLCEAVPGLADDYRLVDRLGTGTFSSVYKAVDLGYHTRWDNSAWHGHHPPGSSAYYQSMARPRGSRVFVALKRIYVTSNPERIRNEIAIMEDCRACRHISQLITAFRYQDQVVAVMPYQRNEDFREYYQIMPMEGMKSYFRCMFRALRDIHARGIIHRDVKPANFLFDPLTGVGTLCDFGLACRMGPGPTLGACLHLPPSTEYPHGRLRKFDQEQIEHIKKMQRDARVRSTWTSDRVGYPDKDARPHSKANRAGTRGFRAPEVLFKCGEQSGAVDVWSAGVILLSMLSSKFPLFQANDDVEALMEIACIVGRRKMEKAATLHSRTFASNVPSITQDGMAWQVFCEKQNENLYTPPPPDPRFYPHSLTSSSAAHPPNSSSPRSSLRASSTQSGAVSPSLAPPDVQAHADDVAQALDFVSKLLDPEATKRITPRQALSHPFLRPPGVDETYDGGVEDDAWAPHPFGKGVCGDLHFKHERTDQPCVRVRGVNGAWKVLIDTTGEGTAIGHRPCEYHRREFSYVDGEPA